MNTRKIKLLVTIVLMGAVFAAAGQPGRGNQNDNRGNKNEKKETKGFEKKNDSREYARNKGEYRPVNREINQRDAYKREVRRVEDNRKYRAEAVPVKARVPNHFHGNKHYRYVPNYGHTVKHFKGKPVVFHTSSSRFYFYNDHFYRYHNGIGYIWVESPYGMIFPQLPNGSVLVHIGGRPYFRYGNVWFVHHRRGYEVVSVPARFVNPRPVIHISASF